MSADPVKPKNSAATDPSIRQPAGGGAAPPRPSQAGQLDASRDQAAAQVARDQLALIRIEGMHCHRCEQSISKALAAYPGVHEVEVDFNSGQASVLYDRSAVNVGQLMEAVNAAGYRAAGFPQRQADRPA